MISEPTVGLHRPLNQGQAMLLSMISRSSSPKLIAGLILIGIAPSQYAVAQKAPASEPRTGVPLTKEQLINTFAVSEITFGGGDYPSGCQVVWGGDYGLATTVKNCGRADGRYSAWAWGGNEIRFVGQRGVARKMYFYRRPNGQYYVLDERGNYAEVTSVRR